MTREEAIKTLANFKRYISGGGVIDAKANEALDMAIKALEKQDDEPVGCYGCVHERHGNQVCDACARSCLDRYVGGEVG